MSNYLVDQLCINCELFMSSMDMHSNIGIDSGQYGSNSFNVTVLEAISCIYGFSARELAIAYLNLENEEIGVKQNELSEVTDFILSHGLSLCSKCVLSFKQIIISHYKLKNEATEFSLLSKTLKRNRYSGIKTEVDSPEDREPNYENTVSWETPVEDKNTTEQQETIDNPTELDLSDQEFEPSSFEFGDFDSQSDAEDIKVDPLTCVSTEDHFLPQNDPLLTNMKPFSIVLNPINSENGSAGQRQGGPRKRGDNTGETGTQSEGIKFIKSKRGKDMLVDNQNNIYEFSKMAKDGNKIWMCTRYHDIRCKGRARTSGQKITITQPHSFHSDNALRKKRMEAKSKIKQLASITSKSPDDIIASVLQEDPSLAEEAQLPKLVSLKRTIYKLRRDRVTKSKSLIQDLQIPEELPKTASKRLSRSRRLPIRDETNDDSNSNQTTSSTNQNPSEDEEDECNFKFIKSKRGKDMLVDKQNNIYELSRLAKGGKKIWVCSRYHDIKCRGRAHTVGGKMRITQPHSLHTDNDLKIKCREAKSKIKELAATTAQPSNEIIESVFQEDPTLAAESHLPKLLSLRTAINRIRRADRAAKSKAMVDSLNPEELDTTESGTNENPSENEKDKLNIKFIKSKRGKDMLVDKQNNIYIFSKMAKDGKKIWACVRYHDIKCRGRAYTEGEKIKITQPHSFHSARVTKRMELQSTMEISFKCGCGYSGLKAENLVSHETKCKYENPIMCDICGEFFKKSSALYVHKRVKHSEVHPLYPKCDLCGAVFLRGSTLRDHITTTHSTEGAAFVCDKCGDTFKTLKNLRRHERKVHSEDSVDKQLLRCQECGILVKNKHDLKKHLRNMHTSNEIIPTGIPNRQIYDPIHFLMGNMRNNTGNSDFSQHN